MGEEFFFSQEACLESLQKYISYGAGELRGFKSFFSSIPSNRPVAYSYL